MAYGRALAGEDGRLIAKDVQWRETTPTSGSERRSGLREGRRSVVGQNWLILVLRSSTLILIPPTSDDADLFRHTQSSAIHSVPRS